MNIFQNKASYYLSTLVNPRSKKSFIFSLPANAVLLDVGCGNNAPFETKSLRSDLYYVGLDIQDYHNSSTSISYADEYVITSPETFSQKINELGQRFDAVISRHNLEHCDKPLETLISICSVVKPGGVVFLAFPSEKSIHLPKGRVGTLNFYDDPTHVYLPIFNDVIELLQKNKMEIIYSIRENQDWFSRIRGAINEPRSKRLNTVLPGTWAFWGFETIIWAQKRR